MGTSLTGLTPATTYDALIKVGDNGPLSATAKFLSDGLGNDSVLALSTGNVGVGTTTITTISGTNPVLTIGGTAISGGLVLQRSGTDKARLYESGDLFIHQGMSSVGHSFYVNASTEAMRITSAGNVGIGTSNPQGKLHVSSTGDTYFVLTGGSTPLSYSFLVDANDLRLFTGVGSSEKLRVTSSYLRMASGTGGIQFNGDTAAANALDDYEEGTWTPTYRQDGTANTATYATRLGTYTKIGNLVTAFFDIDASSLTAGSGNCQVAGLPFTVSNSMAGFSFVSFRDPSVFVGTATDVTFIGFAQKAETYIMCRNISTTTGAESAQTSFASSGRVTGVVQYIA
jgi:hypothetical protein